MRLGHLTRRFVGSLWPFGPSAAGEAWVAGVLLPGELSLWCRMSKADRRHAVAVARRVERTLGEHTSPPVLAAALLHDVGKVESGLGTFGRVVATLVGAVLRGAHEGDGRIASYLRHDRIGADLLQHAGSAALTVAWAREHHLSDDRWTVPRPLATALNSADDD